MRKKRINFNEREWRLLLHSLNLFRNDLIRQGRYTDVIDEVMLKIIKARIRKVKVS